jgi:hypothetical protein
MRWNRIACVLVVLGGLTSLSAILASVLGAHAILLATGSTICTIVAARAVAGVHDGKEDRRKVEAFRLERMEHQQDARRDRDKAGLDPECAELLQKAEAAVRSILASDARAEGLLNYLVDEDALTDSVEAISALAFDITGLRAELRSISAESLPGGTSRPDLPKEPLPVPAGPMTADAIKPGWQAIAIALESARSRLHRLERYALSVSKVDAAYRDWTGTQRAEGLHPRFREIVAKTAADELAVRELDRLTEKAAEAERGFRQSVEEAELAGGTLALPDDEHSGAGERRM